MVLVVVSGDPARLCVVPGAAQSQSPRSEPGRSQLLHTESQSSYQQTQQRRNSFRFRYSDPQQSNQPTHQCQENSRHQHQDGHSEVFQGAPQLW